MELDHMTRTLLGPSTCPEDIDRALKEIDADAELLHLGGSKWWLGVRAPNPKAREIVESGKLLEQLTAPEAHAMDPAERAMVAVDLEKEYTMYQIMAGGFRPIALYDTEGKSPGWDIVEDFQIRDWNWRNTSEAETERRVRGAISVDEGNRRRIARAAEALRDKAAEVYDYVFRGRRSVTVDSNLE